MFLTLPIAFGALPFGDWAGLAFFLLLFVAGLASAISLLELLVAPLKRVAALSRPRVALLSGGLRPLSFWSSYRDYGVFDVIDGFASNLLLPLSGLLVAGFAAWRIGASGLADELAWRDRSARALRFLLRWVTPLLILASLFAGLL